MYKLLGLCLSVYYLVRSGTLSVNKRVLIENDMSKSKKEYRDISVTNYILFDIYNYTKIKDGFSKKVYGWSIDPCYIKHFDVNKNMITNYYTNFYRLLWKENHNHKEKRVNKPSSD